MLWLGDRAGPPHSALKVLTRHDWIAGHSPNASFSMRPVSGASGSLWPGLFDWSLEIIMYYIVSLQRLQWWYRSKETFRCQRTLVPRSSYQRSFQEIPRFCKTQIMSVSRQSNLLKSRQSSSLRPDLPVLHCSVSRVALSANPSARLSRGRDHLAHLRVRVTVPRYQPAKSVIAHCGSVRIYSSCLRSSDISQNSRNSENKGK